LQVQREHEMPRSLGSILYAARWATIVGVLLASELEFTSARVQRLHILVAVIALAAMTFLVGTIFKGRGSPAMLATVDIATVTLIVLFSDGIQSPFYPLFYITIISAAIYLGLKGAVICAALITLLSFAAEIADVGQKLTEPRVIEDFVRTTPYLFLIAIITGALRDKLRTATEIAADLRIQQAAIEREMELAKSVQMAQLPREVPSIPGLEVVAFYKPARDVGGDLYDFHPVHSNELGVTVADVTGKGVPAALLISTAKYAVREYDCPDLRDMMSRVNRLILKSTTDEMFITLLHGRLDVHAKIFTFANAGHVPPMVFRSATGEVEVFNGSSPPLGIFDNAPCEVKEVALQTGDTLVLCTDGLPDALTEEGTGIDEMVALVCELTPLDLNAWPDELTRRLEKACRIDDVTVVAVRLTS